ncbi:MAG: hypothetical protein MZV70_62825 [Desulfobacterales bacterium]|nr:hypothetical protein [Desulfobacterales bacterium]
MGPARLFVDAQGRRTRTPLSRPRAPQYDGKTPVPAVVMLHGGEEQARPPHRDGAGARRPTRRNSWPSSPTPCRPTRPSQAASAATRNSGTTPRSGSMRVRTTWMTSASSPRCWSIWRRGLLWTLGVSS